MHPSLCPSFCLIVNYRTVTGVCLLQLHFSFTPLLFCPCLCICICCACSRLTETAAVNMHTDKCIHCCLSPLITMPTTANYANLSRAIKRGSIFWKEHLDEPSACQTTLDSQRPLICLFPSPLNSLPILLNFAPRPEWENESKRARE